MPDNTTSRLDSLGALADQQRLSAPRMMSGQFPDEVLDPAVRELEKKGIVVDRDALRARFEQEFGFADVAKYWNSLLPELARQMEKEGLRLQIKDRIFAPADIRDFARRLYPEPGPQSGLLQAPRSSLTAYAPQTLPTDAATGPTLKPLSPALSARVHTLLSSQGEPTPSTTA